MDNHIVRRLLRDTLRLTLTLRILNLNGQGTHRLRRLQRLVRRILLSLLNGVRRLLWRLHYLRGWQASGMLRLHVLL